MKTILGVVFPVLGIILILCSFIFGIGIREERIDILIKCFLGGAISLLLGEYINNKHYIITIRKITQFYKSINQMCALQKASLCLIICLLLCLLPLPYDMYTLVRLATTIIMGCWGIWFYKNNKITLAVISVSVMVLFQPIFQISLDRLTWNMIDIILAVFLSILVFKNRMIIK